MKNQIKAQLRNQGFYVTDQWLDSLNPTLLGDIESVKRKYLETNIDLTSEAIPDFIGFSENHKKTKADYVVQVDEVVDISLPQEDRINLKRSPKGTLKFLLNSGGNRFPAIEKETIDSKSISLFMTPGSKVQIKAGSDIWYGVLFLTKSNITFLGGVSQEIVNKRSFIYSGKQPVQQRQPQETHQSPQNLPHGQQQNVTTKNPPIIIKRTVVPQKQTQNQATIQEAFSNANQNMKTPQQKVSVQKTSNEMLQTPKPSSSSISSFLNTPVQEKSLPSTFLTPTPETSPIRLTQNSRKRNNFDFSSSDELSDETSFSQKKTTNSSTSTPKVIHTKLTKEKESSFSSDLEDLPKKEPLISPTQRTKKKEKPKLTKEQAEKFLNEDDSQNLNLSVSDEPGDEESPKREILPPISPSTGVLDMIGLLALHEHKGSEFLVNAKFSQLNDCFLSGDVFVGNCYITNGNISSLVAIHQNILMNGLQIRSIDEYRNMSDDETYQRKQFLSEYLQSFLPPLKVLDRGTLPNNEPRFLLIYNPNSVL